MKNILAENMRRFGTKNLTELMDPETKKKVSEMASWTRQYINNHDFKPHGDDNGTRIYLSPMSIKGRVELRVWVNPNEPSNNRIDIAVLRQGVAPGARGQGVEDTLYDKSITVDTWNPSDMPTVERMLQQYLPR